MLPVPVDRPAQGPAPLDQATRQPARPLVPTPDIDGGSGRDRVSVSALAREVAARSAARDARSDEPQVAEAAGGLFKSAKGFIHKALNSMRQDLGELLKGFGLGGKEVKEFAQSFVEPALAALKEGVDFTAELSFAAFSQETRVSDTSFSQSTSLVAKSLTIDVNNTTGEISVSLASLSVEEEIRVVSSGGAAPLLELGPGVPALPTQPLDEEGEEEEDPLTLAIQEAQQALAKQGHDFQARISLRAIEALQNEAGQTLTRFTLDAAVALRPQAEAEGAETEAEAKPQSLDVSV